MKFKVSGQISLHCVDKDLKEMRGQVLWLFLTKNITEVAVSVKLLAQGGASRM